MQAFIARDTNDKWKLNYTTGDLRKRLEEEIDHQRDG